MAGLDPKKCDPARAHVLDAPGRERYLPTDALVALLELPFHFALIATPTE
jgi:hypothetical protein